jgi:hypothetical protein
MLLAISAPFAWGQDMPSNQTFIGYQLQRLKMTASDVGLNLSTGSYNFNGMNVSNAARLHKWLGVEGDFAAGYKPIYSERYLNLQMLAGPRVQYSFGRFAFYGHFLFGWDMLRTPADFIGNQNAFSYGGGGGASVYLTKHFGVNGGLDYFRASKNVDHVTVGLDTLRVSAGPVFIWGGTRQITAKNRGNGDAPVPSRVFVPAPQMASTPAPVPQQTAVTSTPLPAQPKVVCTEVQISESGVATCTMWKQEK